jgi:hypothetical protein
MVDPHWIQQQTRSLLEFLYHHPLSATTATTYEDISAQRGHVYDLQRYGPAYEAAALYHTIQQQQQQSIRTKSKKNHPSSTYPNEPDDKPERTVSQRKKQKKSKSTERWSKKNDECLSMDEEDDYDDDGDEHSRLDTSDSRHPEHDSNIGSSHIQPITVEDILQAHASSFTYLEFQQVLPRIRQVAALYKEQQQQKQQQLLQQDKKRTSKNDSKNTQKPSLMIQKYRGKLSTIDAANDHSRNQNIVPVANQHPNVTKEELDDFGEWKRRILEQACEPFRPWNHISEAIPKAAEAILQKYDLISKEY